MYERHQLRIQAIYQASFEEAITLLDLVNIYSTYTLGSYAVNTCIGKPRQTFPNQSFQQIIDINSSTKTKMGNFAKEF